MIEGALQEVTPGALLWHVEGDPAISRSDWDNPYSCLAVPFETEPYRGVRRAARLSWWRELDEVQRFCTQLLTSYLDSHFDRDLLCRYAYSRLLFQSRICGQSGAYAEFPEKLRKALELMTRQDAKAFSVGGVARQVGWSLPHLHQVFHDKLGTTPHQFIMERRIKVAKDQLAATDFPIKKIALDCGFANPAAFCHAFRQRTGITPLHYRKQEIGKLHK
jgi:AraC-like DNA-binding protein